MIYVIMGPTCSRKTSAAIKLANFLNCPIINADAFQIYKDMNIGTAKISSDDSNYNKHYLLDIVTPDETFSVKQFQDVFRKTLDNLLINYKDVVVCGGTGLYIKASFYDYVFNLEENRIVQNFDSYDNETLWQMLNKVDNQAAASIHKNNRKRVIRALEICQNNQSNKTSIINNQSHKLIYKDVEFLFINPDRTFLYENINKRVDVMFDNNLIGEVKHLLSKYNLSLTSKQAIGYKEVIEYLNGDISLDKCKNLIKQRTRNYAKRQITFFTHQFTSKMYSSSEELLRTIIKNG